MSDWVRCNSGVSQKIDQRTKFRTVAASIFQFGEGWFRVSGSWEGLTALPAPSEPDVRVSPHTAQASANMVKDRRDGRPDRHHRWMRARDVSPVTASRYVNVMTLPCCWASSSKSAPQTAHRPSCRFSRLTRWTRDASRNRRCLRRASQYVRRSGSNGPAPSTARPCLPPRRREPGLG